MKNSKFLIIALALVLAFTGCKKEAGPKGETGATGAQGAKGDPGPSAKTFTFNGTFDATTTFMTYTNVIAFFDADDMVIVYVNNATYSGVDHYVALPLVDNSINVNMYAEINENTGSMYVNTDKLTGTGSPWSTSVTFKFKAILIKSAKFIKTVNYKEYSEVQKAYGIE